MAAGPPLWLKLVLRAERAIGGPVEAAVRSDKYFDAVATINKTKARVVGSRPGRLRARLASAQPAGGNGHQEAARAARADGPAARAADQGARGVRGARPRGGGLTHAAPAEPRRPARPRQPRRRTLAPARPQRVALRARDAPPAARGDAQGRRLAARQGAAVALPRRGAGPLRAAAADRHQPRQPQLHPRPAAGLQRRRVPARRRASTSTCSTGASRTSSTRTTASRPTSTSTSRAPSTPSLRHSGRRRADDGRLLPRRRALDALRQRPPRRAGAQPDPDGHARGLHGDGRDGRRDAARVGSIRTI